MRVHLRRIKDVLNLAFHDQLWTAAPCSPDHFSPTLLPTLAKDIQETSIESHFLSAQPLSLSTVYDKLNSTVCHLIIFVNSSHNFQPIECLRSISFDSWNPPTGNRMLLVICFQSTRFYVSLSDCATVLSDYILTISRVIWDTFSL